jgi:membrane protein
MASSSRKSRSNLEFLLGIVRKMGSDRVLLMSSGLSYCAVLSLAPLVIVTLGVVGLVTDRVRVRQHLVEHVQRLTGADTAGLIGQLAESQRTEGSGQLAAMLGAVTLVIGATAVFVQLQNGLNVIWDVEPRPGTGLLNFVRKRLISLAMVGSLGFLLLVSLLASAVLGAALERLTFLSEAQAVVGLAVNTIVTLLLSTALFALLFRFVPDARTAWRDVWLGGAVTAVIFHVGEWAIGQYLARGTVGSPYGAAGSVVVLLVWVYYSSIIVFAGAEFTQQWAVRRGRGTAPEPHARRGHEHAPASREHTPGRAPRTAR